jgi:TfoX/Sxy family transcriptional regulator of competence genes
VRLPPSPPELVELWASVLPTGPDTAARKMFGYPSVFVNGNLACGLHQDRLLVRLGDADRDEALALPGAERFEPMAGRVMKNYVLLPPALHGDVPALESWLERAAEHARSLPPKEPGARSRKTRG